MATPSNPSQETAQGAPKEANAAAWMARYGAALTRYFRKRTNAAEAEDLVQSVFLRLQNRAKVEAIDDAERYLFRIANNVLVDRHHAETLLSRRLDEAYEIIFERSDDISPERVLIAKQTLDQLTAAIHDLPPRTREAFTLHRFEEMTYAAIAKRMQISVGVVERHMARAMQHLNARMGRR
jgi:RNA polymerase sigma factor (sigma-70 family)